MDLSEEMIRKMAKARVEFKQHAATYVIVNALLVGIWFVTHQMGNAPLTWPSFWPVWPILGWGIGLAFHGWGAYRPEGAMVEREMEKIRNRGQ